MASDAYWGRCSCWESHCDEVEGHKALAATCNQDRAEMGQLECPRPAMTEMGEASNGVCGDKFCGTVPSGCAIESH